MIKLSKKSISLLLTLLLANGCAGTFARVVGAGSEVPGLLEDLAAGGTVTVDTVLSSDINGNDAVLARAERGRIAQIQGDSVASVPEFKGAIEKIKEFEERAKVSASDVGAHGAALVINDNLIPYEPAGFEKVLVYHFQALNYLMQGKLEAAGVEVRRANAEQVRALKEHQQELAKAEGEARAKGFATSDFVAGINQSLGDSQAVAALVKNSFQNAYTFYMSAVVHELMNESNDAYIDYKKALEIAPENGFIQSDVARLAKSLSMTDDISKFSKRFPKAFAAAKGRNKAKTEVIVLFEDGLVPGKSKLSFPIPIFIPGAPGLTTVSIPTFEASVSPVYPVILKVSDIELARSQRICAIDALAVKAYEESAPAMITRQVIRAAIKGAASSMASQHGGEWGELAGVAVSIFNIVTEHADIRSWRSLPQNAQVLRAEVAPGATLRLVHNNSGASGVITLPKESGKRVIVWATRIESKLFVHHVVV